ncbi:helix-turn-helix transcriptional regulator [Variovorax robiniae]|uniref:Helix-turn-helix transcriptional regulator n=1 Tax=Variovorax robiniae TaxID=1836199 RepID=A0ABU8XAI1_9BURK
MEEFFEKAEQGESAPGCDTAVVRDVILSPARNLGFCKALAQEMFLIMFNNRKSNKMRNVMPAKAPMPKADAADVLGALGARIRQRRKDLRVSAITASEAAGLSRVTLHRIECGEPSVTMGAYANAMAALGMKIHVVNGGDGAQEVAVDPAAVRARKVRRIQLADYPQLKQLAWHVPGATELTPGEALGLYERNWRHVDSSQLQASERALIDALVRTVGKGKLLV